jgi:peroxiredoxin
MKSLVVITTTLACLIFAGSLSAQERLLPLEAASVKPLEKGAKAPDVNLTDVDGKTVPLSALTKEKPLVIVFFRGSWCPICTKHTQQLIKIYPELKAKGYEMIGISPDSAANSKANAEKGSIPFPIYSDAELNVSRGFGLAFQVDDATLTKYKGFGIDLEKASGKSHHGLPIPAIYVVSKEGTVTFAHSDPDYRKRLDAKDLLEAIGK